jgi:hypothetical protein
MKYEATFKSMIGLTIVLSLLGTLTLFAGLSGNSPSMVVLGIASFVILVIIRVRFKVTFDENYLTSTGFVSTKTLRWSEITRVVRMADCGYPKDRFYGPFVYEFQTKNGSLKINFKLFPIECMTKILKKTKELTTA